VELHSPQAHCAVLPITEEGWFRCPKH